MTESQVDTTALKAAIAASGKTQTEIARQTGVAKSTLSGWLRPGFRNPTLTNLGRLARVLGVEVADLLQQPN